MTPNAGVAWTLINTAATAAAAAGEPRHTGERLRAAGSVSAAVAVVAASARVAGGLAPALDEGQQARHVALPPKDRAATRIH